MEIRNYDMEKYILLYVFVPIPTYFGDNTFQYSLISEHILEWEIFLLIIDYVFIFLPHISYT